MNSQFEEDSYFVNEKDPETKPSTKNYFISFFFIFFISIFSIWNYVFILSSKLNLFFFHVFYLSYFCFYFFLE